MESLKLIKERVGYDKSGHYKSRFKCYCGKIFEAIHCNITSGNTKSCGCFRKKYLTESRLESKNPMWKGDKVGYEGIHHWIKKRLIRPQHCQMCGKESKLDLANISGKYLRDLKDWKYICRKCHMVEDGRINNLIRLPSPSPISCKQCSKTFKPDSKKRKFCSHSCSATYSNSRRYNVSNL